MKTFHSACGLRGLLAPIPDGRLLAQDISPACSKNFLSRAPLAMDKEGGPCV